MKILITGGNGYVARSLYNDLKDQYDVTSISRHDFDLTSFEAMNNFFQGKYFDVVLHCAVQGGSRLRVDTSKDMDVNLVMYYNLLQHKSHYSRFIHFGSGAEVYNPESAYGLSKRVIANSILGIDNFYNIRIYGVFDENELNTRFIKANVLRYIKKDPMIIQDKRMTFFYMQDLIRLVRYHITTDSSQLLKESNCAYTTDHTLLEIANMINDLDEYKVPIYMDTQPQSDYVSNLNAPYGLEYDGLRFGLQNVYNKLRNL